MPTTHIITFYPVGNGDTCQILLAGGKRILFDYCHRKVAEDASDPRIDLKKHLQDELKAASRDYLDMVAFTHADTDHICGSTDFFELRHAGLYQGNGRIKINELWLPAAFLIENVTREQMSDEFAILRREGRYRLLEGKGIGYVCVKCWPRAEGAPKACPRNSSGVRVPENRSRHRRQPR